MRQSVDSLIQYRLGWSYYYAGSKRLPEQAGYKSTWDFFGRNFTGIPRSVVREYGDVAMRFTEAETRLHGVERLQQLTRFLLNHIIGNPGEPDIGQWMLWIPQADGTFVDKRFADCSLEDLRRANRARKPSKPRVPVPDMTRWLFIKDAMLRHFHGGIQVVMFTRLDGTSVLNMGGVPITQLAHPGPLLPHPACSVTPAARQVSRSHVAVLAVARGCRVGSPEKSGSAY